MTFFKNAWDLLLESYDEGAIDEDEFLLLYETNYSKNPEFPNKQLKFNLEELTEAECFAEFRCRNTDVKILGDMLGLPSRFVCYVHVCTVCDDTEGLCIALKRFAYPDLIHRFGKPVPVLSMTNNKVIDFIYMVHGHRITQWDDTILNPWSLQIYADAIHGRGGTLPNCFGFIDGTVRPICRSKKLQRTVYNGHKRFNALKFQLVTLPNRLIAQFVMALKQENLYFH